jgi:hypothetical protein
MVIFQSIFLSEVRGKCKRAQSWLIDYFKHPTPHAWMRKPSDEHFMSYDDIIAGQVFGLVTSERYMTSRQGSSSKSDSKYEQEWDRELKAKVGKNLFNQASIVMTSNCHLCEKPRCIFTLEMGGQQTNHMESARSYLDNTMGIQCGMSLFALNPDVLPLARRVFVQHSVTCSMRVARNYHATESYLNLPSVCIDCGSAEFLVTQNPRDNDGRQV